MNDKRLAKGLIILLLLPLTLAYFSGDKFRYHAKIQQIGIKICASCRIVM